jgi:NAD(P)-dependent dehydrogenase (short-subunit alcohol dehydrogenase family)
MTDWFAGKLAVVTAGAGVLGTSHTCDVADEAQVLRFRDELIQAHAASHLDLVFSNAGIGGGESFVSGRRQSAIPNLGS